MSFKGFTMSTLKSLIIMVKLIFLMLHLERVFCLADWSVMYERSTWKCNVWGHKNTSKKEKWEKKPLKKRWIIDVFVAVFSALGKWG